jgi:hypothetical protein
MGDECLKSKLKICKSCKLECLKKLNKTNKTKMKWRASPHLIFFIEAYF